VLVGVRGGEGQHVLGSCSGEAALY
jgi:hypothetical protein